MRILLRSVALVSVVLPTAGYPQIEEIVVTAQKREENLQDTPIAITAFTGENLEARMITDTSKLADFTPKNALRGIFRDGNGKVRFYVSFIFNHLRA